VPTDPDAPFSSLTHGGRYRINLSWEPKEITSGSETTFFIELLDIYTKDKPIPTEYHFTVIHGDEEIFHKSNLSTDPETKKTELKFNVPKDVSGPITIRFENLGGGIFSNLDFPAVVNRVTTSISSTEPSDTDFTASTFVDKYQDLLQKGGARVSVLIKVTGDVESIDPAKRAKEIRNLQSYVLKFLSYTNGINILSDTQKNEITGQIHPHWIEILEERSEVLSVTILDKYNISKDKQLPPLKQIEQGIEAKNVLCKEGFVLIIKHNGSPACVGSDTTVKLEELGWGGMPLPS